MFGCERVESNNLSSVYETDEITVSPLRNIYFLISLTYIITKIFSKIKFLLIGAYGGTQTSDVAGMNRVF